MFYSISIRASVLCLLFLTAAIFVSAAPGDLDPSFGSGGIVSLPYSGNNFLQASAIAIQSDGKIVTVGFAYDTVYGTGFGLARYNTDGSPDATFGSGGKVINHIGGNGYSVPDAVAIQTDGKIIAAGYNSDYGENSYNFLLARYNTDGSLDSTFGTGGKVLTAFSDAFLADIVVQSDGRIVAVGSGANSSGSDFLLVRYNANGSLDPSFGSSGIVANTFGSGNSNAYAIAIQTDGKIVAAGASGNAFALARYSTDGLLDTSFGTGGKVLTYFNSNTAAYDVAIQANGKIIAVGVSYTTNTYFALARYNTDGSLDSTFGSGGKVMTTFSNGGGFARAVAIQSDGRIVAAGLSGSGNNSSFTLMRYNTDGSLDNSFGSGGKVLTSIGIRGGVEAAAIQSDGKIVAAGSIWESSGGTRFALARYLNNSVTPPAVPRRTRFDFDGDGRADVSVFRPDNGTWYIQPSNSGNFYGVQFGVSTDKLVPADYDGDGKTDIAVYRDGVWYWLNSSDGTFSAYQFGIASDIPVPADYTGDRRAELAVYRAGFWFTLDLTNNQFRAAQFGLASDKPVAADYDGDGKADYAVVRQGGGLSIWYISGSTRGFYGFQFGTDTDKLVPADYDNDGKTDVAVYRNGFWYISVSTQFLPITAQLGTAGDIPVPADYDGDGKADIAIYRNGIWHLQRSTAGLTGVSFGAATDKPVPNPFVP